MTPDCIEQAASAYREHGSVRKAAAALGLSYGGMHGRLAKASELGLVSTKPVMPGFVIKTVSGRGSEGEWIKQAREPGEKFVMPAGHVVKGESALVDGDGRTIAKWVKTREGVQTEDVVATVTEALSNFSARAGFVNAPEETDSDLATVYIAADWHVGLMSWHRETGRNYDLDIAEATIGDGIERLVRSSPPSHQAVVLVLGDLLHSDGYDNMTARSKNVLDVDGRYPKVLRAATRLVRQLIEAAREKHGRVLVRVLPGNHDEESAVAVALALSMLYEGETRVTVDTSASRFWWWQWGANLLGATHGDKAKMPALPLMMATENPAAWGQSKFRSIYTGHIHTQTGIEVSGVTVESFQTPVATDAWHASMGYRANRSMTSITHHRSLGEVSRNKVNIL